MMWALLSRFYPALVCIVVACFIAGTAFVEGEARTQAAWDKAKIADAELLAKQQMRNLQTIQTQIQTIQQAEDQHDKDQATINGLATDLRGLHIHIPACPSTLSDSERTAPDTNAASGVFSAGVDTAFERLQSATGKLIQQCDTLNVDAIRANREAVK